MKTIKNVKKEVQYVCSHCGDLLPSVHTQIKTKRGTLLRLCQKCIKSGL
jgi:DNA-directed RNA polymerase subunit RPC12/RpoP